MDATTSIEPIPSASNECDKSINDYKINDTTQFSMFFDYGEDEPDENEDIYLLELKVLHEAKMAEDALEEKKQLEQTKKDVANADIKERPVLQRRLTELEKWQGQNMQERLALQQRLNVLEKQQSPKRTKDITKEYNDYIRKLFGDIDINKLVSILRGDKATATKASYTKNVASNYSYAQSDNELDEEATPKP